MVSTSLNVVLYDTTSGVNRLGVDEEWSDSDGEEEQHALESDQCLERESCPPDETQTTVKESDAAQSSSSAGVLIGSPKDEVASANESSPSHSCSTKDVDTDTTAVHVQDKNGECQADTSKCQEVWRHCYDVLLSLLFDYSL